MKPSSSTSVSRRPRSPTRDLLLFFGAGLATIVAINALLQWAYQEQRYGGAKGEYAQKLAAARAKFAGGARIGTLFVGDSTISVGVMPRLLGAQALNLAWSGFEPSELGVLERRILEFPDRPSNVIIGMNPTFLSQNEWRNPQDVPFWSAARDALSSFYVDSNSFKPFLLSGGLAAFANRFLGRPFTEKQVREEAQTVTVHEDGLVTIFPERRSMAREREDLELPFRKQNFEMLEGFRNRFTARGVRVSYLMMPYTSGFERVLREGPKAKVFTARARAEIDRIFGKDVIDLSGAVPDELFRDGVHLTEAGAESLTGQLRERIAGSTPPVEPIHARAAP